MAKLHPTWPDGGGAADPRGGFITVFADASLCPSTGAAGWGAWAKRASMLEGVTFGGGFPGTFGTSAAVELAAIEQALLWLAEDGYLEGIAAASLQSDSTEALGVLRAVAQARYFPYGTRAAERGGAPVSLPRRVAPGLAEVGRRVRALAEARGMVLHVKHVRGHRPGGGRQWVNRQCDWMARQHMEHARQQYRLL